MFGVKIWAQTKSYAKLKILIKTELNVPKQWLYK